MNELTAHCCGCQLAQCFSLVPLRSAHGDLFDLVDGHGAGPPQTLDDSLCAHALLHELFDFLEDLAGQDDHGRRAIADFCVLRPRNVRQYPCRRVDYVEEFHDRRAVVGDGLSAIAVDEEEIAAIRAQRRFHCALYRETGIDI